MKTMDVFYDNFVKANQNIETDIIAIAHSADPSSAEYLENKILESGLKFNNIYVVEADSNFQPLWTRDRRGFIYRKGKYVKVIQIALIAWFQPSSPTSMFNA